MQRRAVRLKDIAAKADVSLAAVSRILRDQNLSEFSAATQKRVRQAADDLGWRPNLLVRGLQTGKTGTIGVFVAPFDTYWTGVLYGIHDALLAADHVPIVLWPHALVHPAINRDPAAAGETAGGAAGGGRGVSIGHSPVPDDGSAPPGRGERDRLTRLVDRRVDAIIAWPLFEADAAEMLAQVAGRGWPVVTIDDTLPNDVGRAITSDEADNARQVLDHLAGLGHRRIGYVGLDRQQAWATRRLAAVTREAQARGVDLRPDMLALETAGDAERPRIAAYLRERPGVTAVIASADHIAMQVVEAAAGLGRDVPGDLSVVGFGNEVFDAGTTRLTTVDHHPFTLGRQAASLALADGRGDASAGLTTVKGELIVRASTAPADHAPGP